MIWKILFYIAEESEQSQALAIKLDLLLILEAAEPMENLPLFKLARNCYINMSISFFWKLPDWFLFSLLQTYCA